MNANLLWIVSHSKPCTRSILQFNLNSCCCCWAYSSWLNVSAYRALFPKINVRILLKISLSYQSNVRQILPIPTYYESGMFSVMSVCQWRGRWSPCDMRHICSNLSAWEPRSSPALVPLYLFKLVHYVAHKSSSKQADGLRMKGLLFEI